jgi:FkbM family methyltransferase
MLAKLRTARGIARSLCTYYCHPVRAARMDRLYSQFVRPDNLVFDIGAHVGDRIASFRRLGARVIAVEPQPTLVKLLRLIYGRTSAVTIEATAIGVRSGTIELMMNIDNPTVSTASRLFVDAARGAPGWEKQYWTDTVQVPVTTLDALIARHGTPVFIKIDIEGFEAEALAGLSCHVKALSFEFTTIQRDVAHRCIERCVALGYAHFNAVLGETQAFEHSGWIDAAAITRWLTDLPHRANSGDVYAVIA